jgi:carbamoyltransferase
MIKWGISANSHDAALAVFDQDKLVFASHSERFSKIKNDRDLSREMLSYAKQFGTPDEVYWYENTRLKTLRQFYAGQGLKLKDNDLEIYLARYEISAPIKQTTHHRSHAAAGYFTSSFDEAAILVIDAIGEFETLTIWKAQGANLTKVYSKWYPNSVGLFYSAMTQRLGLKPLEDEYVLMGMAAFGDKSKYINEMADYFVKDFENFKFEKNLHRGCMDWRSGEIPVSDYFDVAAATQGIYEIMFKHALVKAKELTGMTNLVVMGGCALNCSANPLAYQYFDRVWIMPNPGDAGSSIGAVLAHSNTHIDWQGPYLGYDLGYKDSNVDIVDWLLAHHICGVARGPAEFGPRSLGNRSLFADPRGKNVKQLVNSVKKRQDFRPFAPVITAEQAPRYFDLIGDHRYMQHAVRCRFPDTYPGIVHQDGTSRVQIVSKQDNPQLHDLLTQWQARSGCPMLLNTSLNIKGQPMVNDRNDARAFERLHKIRVFN